MFIRDARPEDFEIAFDYIEKLWTYNTYDRDTIRAVYESVLSREDDFAFFLFEGDEPKGFCHGTMFPTFWLSGATCYLSSIISNQADRGKGYGKALMDHAVAWAKERGCHAIVLDSGLPREEAHAFYERYGFQHCAHCYMLPL